jgi:radical SAM protein with 4Fe4S-binding SPASM domain
VNRSNAEKYFNLNPDCFLIKGAKRGALYNLANGEVFSIDPVSVRILEGCENHDPIDEISSAVQKVTRDQIVDYLKKIEEAGMGRLSAEPSTEPKIDVKQRYEKLDFIWLELREDCNLKCRHCYCMSKPAAMDVDRLTHEEWKRMIDEAHDLGCRALQFIGGEPFLYGDKLFDLAEHAASRGYENMEIFSNLTILKDEWIDKMVEMKIDAATSIYSKRPEIHDLCTTVPGAFERTIRSFRKLKERGIDTRVACTVMKQNQDYLEETMEFLIKDLKARRPGFDPVRPSGRGNDEEIYPDKISKKAAYRTRAQFMDTDRNTFMKRINGNGCWQGKVVVSSTGVVYPCIMQRDDESSNVRDSSLESIIKGSIRKYWDISYDDIEVCRDCEYRYACHDCRPVAYGLSGKLTAKSLHCSYDPYEGEWKNVE